jgi:hypothetical protein
VIGILLKLLGWSATLSVLIKYGGAIVAPAPSTITVLIAVWLPSLVMAIVLGYRAWVFLRLPDQ